MRARELGIKGKALSREMSDGRERAVFGEQSDERDRNGKLE
jgi:hypothetical protein